MAHCPKCGKKLKLTDISQFCPACGVNMRFVNFEDNFYREAKMAELTQAGMHVKVKRFKAAFIGSKLAIARLVVMLLPIVALLLPNGSVSLTLPFRTSQITFGALGIYSIFTDGTLNYVMSMAKESGYQAVYADIRNALFAYAAVAVVGVLVLLFSILCFISYKNMQKFNVVAAGLGIAAAAVAMVMIAKAVKSAGACPLMEAKYGYGLLLCIAMFAAVFAVNLLLTVKGIPVEYDEGMLERVEIYKKVKAGEIDLETLPQPIVETAETRKIDEEIAKEEDAYNKKHAGEETENVRE
ncbi:MAG: zinc ribbon domain-containing protein [Clostridia bacterium]|nr:zinc ribbon domain-containing protein [Clostridia bacterium]